MKHTRAYLDNAATTWPKPPAVYEASDYFLRNLGASPGRGTHREALEAKRIVDQTRAKLRRLFAANADDPVVFCFNGTDALNLCIRGIVREGDHVIATVTDHNSVLRPLRDLESTRSIVVDLADCDQRGYVSPAQIERFFTPKTRLVVMPHPSNVTGTIQPVDKIGELVHEAGALFLIDAAQTAGTLPLSLYKMHTDMIATSGHKGLLGPLGTGVAAFRHTLVDQLPSLRQGGTGTQSEDDRQPTHGEQKYESGSLNLPGIAGLEAGLDYVYEESKRIDQSKQRLTKMLLEGLLSIPSVTIYGSPSMENRVRRLR